MNNRNNFLRWKGALYSLPFFNIAANKSVAMLTGASYIDVDVLQGSSATLGIDPHTVFGTQSLAGQQPRWNVATGRLRIFRPTVGAVNMSVQWGFNDYKGNGSNLGVVNVDLTQLPVGWRVHPPSQYCMKGAFNQNTGYKAYSLLEQYYTATNALYLPLTTKANVNGEPGYVGPVVDSAACPIASVAPFVVRNQTPSGSNITITRVLFSVSGQPNIIDLNSLAIAAGASQTFNIPTGFYTSIQVYHSQGTPGGRYVDYSPGNANTVSQALTTSAGTPNNFTATSHIQPGSTILVY